MPAYNGERFIAQSILSVLAQTYRGLELIVIDDGSTDRTADIVREFQKTDNRIRYIRQKNSGQAAARNTGIRDSQGDLIAFLDQDDLWLEQKLEVQIKAIDEAGVDVVFSSGDIFSEEDVPCEFVSFPGMAGKYQGREMFRLLFIYNRIPVLTAIVRKEALSKSSLLDEDLRYQGADDYDLWLRMAAGGATFLGLADKLVRYRVHRDQASGSMIRMLEAELAVLRKHESNILLNQQDKSRRFRSICQQLICALLEEGRAGEARKCFKEVLAVQSSSASVLAQLSLLWFLPRHYKRIMDLAHRSQESFSYRIGHPVRRVFGLRSSHAEKKLSKSGESIVIIESDKGPRPTVSIVIPTYDYAHVIAQALESVRSQTYTDWECIVVDDGSTDNTEEVVALYVQQDPRIRFIRQSNQRQAAARNTGIKNSAGAYLQFLDADDLIEPRKLELQVAYLEQHPEVDITYSGVRYFTSDHVGERLLSRQYSSWEGAGAWMPEISGEGTAILPVLLRNNIMVVNSPLLRRRVVDQVGLFDVGLTPVEDWDYWIRCAAQGLTVRFNDFAESRALVRAHDLSASKDQRRMLRATLLMRRQLPTLLVDRDLRDLNQERLVEAEGHLGIEEVINGSMSTGLYQILKAAAMAPRLRFKAKWMLCAWSAPFVSHDRLRQMVTSSVTRSSGKGKSLESD